LKNVRVIPKRAEDVHEHFDWLISRAVAPADVLRLNISDEVALLIGEEDSVKLRGERTSVPWGNQRVLFHVKR
jgi:16S rRNA G527 N7-methylase RsmG